MWYQDEKKEKLIDYQKPIVYKKGEQLYLLLPQINGSYTVIGYNWFNLNTGMYNSCCLFKTPQDAIKSYGGSAVYNAELHVNVL